MSLLKRKTVELAATPSPKKRARSERKPRVSFSTLNLVRQPSSRDENGNPVPVGPEHFGKEPMKDPPKPKSFAQKKFFFKILHRIAKADKDRSRGKVAENTNNWLTKEYVHGLILHFKRDDTMSVQEVVETLLAFLVQGINDSMNQRKKFMVGDYKLPYQWLRHYLGHLLVALQQIVHTEPAAPELAAASSANKFILSL